MDYFQEKLVSPVESNRPSLMWQGSAWKGGRHHLSPCHVFEEELKRRKKRKLKKFHKLKLSTSQP